MSPIVVYRYEHRTLRSGPWTYLGASPAVSNCGYLLEATAMPSPMSIGLPRFAFYDVDAVNGRFAMLSKDPLPLWFTMKARHILAAREYRRRAFMVPCGVVQFSESDQIIFDVTAAVMVEDVEPLA